MFCPFFVRATKKGPKKALRRQLLATRPCASSSAPTGIRSRTRRHPPVADGRAFLFTPRGGGTIPYVVCCFFVLYVFCPLPNRLLQYGRRR